MPTSQNGFTANSRALVRSVTIPGTDVRVAVRIGAAGDLLLYVAQRWHREVEALRAPDGVLDCWGYAERAIRGSATTLSNHASGTALDFRARIHPLGRRGTYSARQLVAIRAILRDCRGLVRWGGDYRSRADEMHVEIVGTEAQCAALLRELGVDGYGGPARPAPSAPAPLARPEPAAVPVPRTLREDLTMDVLIVPNEAGHFRRSVKVEAGAGSAVADRAFVTLGAIHGRVRWVLTVHGADGGSFRPSEQWDGFVMEAGGHFATELPTGSRTLVLEGQALDPGAQPCASVWHQQ